MICPKSYAKNGEAMLISLLLNQRKSENPDGFNKLGQLYNPIKSLSKSSYLQDFAFLQQKAVHEHRKALGCAVSHTPTSQTTEQTL